MPGINLNPKIIISFNSQISPVRYILVLPHIQKKLRTREVRLGHHHEGENEVEPGPIFIPF